MRRLLEVDRYPEIRFTIGAVEASFNSITAGRRCAPDRQGRTALRGVERPLTFLARARLRDDRIWVRGESGCASPTSASSPPSRFFFSVGDKVSLELRS